MTPREQIAEELRTVHPSTPPDATMEMKFTIWEWRALLAQGERINELEIQLKVQRDILDTPVVEPFAEAVALEAKHQIFRHGKEHDIVKDAFDWYWALGYLGGKAARADKDDDVAKALHHTITAAALLANWHRHLIFRRDNGASTETACSA